MGQRTNMYATRSRKKETGTPASRVGNRSGRLAIVRLFRAGWRSSYVNVEILCLFWKYERDARSGKHRAISGSSIKFVREDGLSVETWRFAGTTYISHFVTDVKHTPVICRGIDRCLKFTVTFQLGPNTVEPRSPETQ